MPIVATTGAVAAVQSLHPRNAKCKIILTSDLKAAGTGSHQGTDWSALIWLIWIIFLFNLQIWHRITKNAWFIHNEGMTVCT